MVIWHNMYYASKLPVYVTCLQHSQFSYEPTLAQPSIFNPSTPNI